MPSIWLPDAPPASAGAADDEFADASAGVPAGWTEVDHGTHQTVSEDEEGLVLSQATHAADSNSGIYKAIPAGDFTIWTKVSLSGPAVTSTISAGLALWEDAANAAGDLFTIQLVCNATATNVSTQIWSDFDTGAVEISRVISVDTWPSHIYFRVRRTGTSYEFDFSSDGIGWQLLDEWTAAFTPTHFGPVMNNVNSGGTVRATFGFFRYVASDVGDEGLVKGDRVTVTAA